MSGLAGRLYGSVPVPLQNVGVSLAGVWLHWRRFGGDGPRHADALLRSQWWDAGRLAGLQERSWLHLARTVLPRVPYYRKVMADHGIEPSRLQGLQDLARFPLLEKEALRQRPQAFVPDGIEPGMLYKSSTSGTTGAPMTLYSDRESERRYYAFYTRLMSWMGVRHGEPRATFYGRTLVPAGQRRPPFWRYDVSENNWQFSSFHLAPDHMPAYLDKLERIQPVELRGYGSSLVEIARAMLAEGGRRRLRPRAVHTTAETLLPSWKDDLQRAFHAPVFDMYGSSEMSHFVTHCPAGRYHVHPEFGILEILVDGRPALPGEEGEVVCTSFINTIQPLVRYRLGDRAKAAALGCPCGRAFPVLESILGRVDDFVVTPEGRRVGRLDPVFKGAARIKECQIVQDQRTRLVLRLVPGEGYKPADAAGVIEELRARVGTGMEIVVQTVDSVPKEANGKFRAVVRTFDFGQEGGGL